MNSGQSIEQVLAKISFNKNVNHARELKGEFYDSCEQIIHRIIEVLSDEETLMKSSSRYLLY